MRLRSDARNIITGPSVAQGGTGSPQTSTGVIIVPKSRPLRHFLFFFPRWLHGLVSFDFAFAPDYVSRRFQLEPEGLEVCAALAPLMRFGWSGDKIFRGGSYARGCRDHGNDTEFTKRHGQRKRRQEAQQVGISSDLCRMWSVTPFPPVFCLLRFMGSLAHCRVCNAPDKSWTLCAQSPV